MTKRIPEISSSSRGVGGSISSSDGSGSSGNEEFAIDALWQQAYANKRRHIFLKEAFKIDPVLSFSRWLVDLAERRDAGGQATSMPQ